MYNVTVKVGIKEFEFEFDQEPTEQQIIEAMEHIGGRPRDRK